MSTYQVIASIRATKIFFNIAWWAVCYKTSSLQDEKSKESIFIPQRVKADNDKLKADDDKFVE